MPRQPLASATRVVTHISVLYVIASIIFIVILGLIAAVFIAERSLRKDIDGLNVKLVNARNSFELGTIAFLKEVSSRTRMANGLLNKHVAISPFFEELGGATFVTVSFSTLSAKITDTQEMDISLDGIASSYNSLILQKDLLTNIPFLTKAKFSNFALDDEGRVGFSFEGSVAPRVIDYKLHLPEE